MVSPEHELAQVAAAVASPCRAWRALAPVFLAYSLPAAAQTALPPASTAPPPAAPTGRIIYYEEGGGLITSVKPPTGHGSKARDAVPGATPAPAAAAPRKEPEAVPAKAAQPGKQPAPVPAKAPRPAKKPQPATPAAAPVEKTTIPSQPAAAPVPLDPQSRDREAYRAILERFATEPGSSAQRAAALGESAGGYIIQFRDASVASRLGWLWLEGQDPASATTWFGHAREWAPGAVEPLRGLAIAAQAQGDHARALAYASEMPPGTPEREPIRQAALLALAQADYDAGRFADAAGHYEDAARSGAIPRYARTQYGRTLLKLGNRRAAADTFSALYRETPDAEAAQGIVAAARAGDVAIDAQLASVEPLAGMLREARATEAYYRRRFLEARALDPQRHSQVGAVGASQALASGQWWEKTGSEGLSRLRARNVVLEAQSSAAELAIAGARWQAAHLEAGTPAPGSLVGSGIEPAGAIPPTRASVGEGEVFLRWERGVAMNALLGAGPFGGPLGARAHGALSVNAANERGELSLGVESRPVRESVLSHAGMEDPGRSGPWGRVTRNGVEARGLWLEHSPWSVGGRIAAAKYQGVRVAGNTYGAAEIAAGYDLRLKGFAYAALGIGASWERYERNLGHFTLGHGGYFSPQRYRKAGASFDFSTEENKPWMVRGRASAARVQKGEDPAPFFPLAPDGRFYDGSSGGGHEAAVQVSAARAVGRYVQVGVAYSRGVSPQYNENLAMLHVRVLFEPRANVASFDLPVIQR